MTVERPGSVTRVPIAGAFVSLGHLPAPARALPQRGHAPARLPPEIAFLSGHGVDLAVLHSAALLSTRQGISADAALLVAGAITETFFYRAFARSIGVAFFDGDVALVAGFDYAAAIRFGVAPLGEGTGRLLAAPRGAQLTAMAHLARRGRISPLSLVITTPSSLSRQIRAASSEVMTQEASDGLPSLDMSLSAKAGVTVAQSVFAGGGAAITALAFAAAPEIGAEVFATGMSCLFLPTIFLRLFAGAASGRTGVSRVRSRLPDDLLPTYSIIVALHREARVVAQLVDALDALDYPRGKLDIKLVLEEDDHATRLALEALSLGTVYEIVVAPAGWPRTKPRALNIALPFLRGEFVAVFDAEDAPDPPQLREAAERFLRAPRHLACVQARLVIDNIDDSWLTRLFAIEYAVLFDVLHQGMAGMQLPIPLGGSSNHFRTSVLREVGGWDAWNVTEDADLGLRLARFGYTTATITSSTREEAPAFLASWIRQRRRWSKGWMQTFVTLSRNPYRLLGEVGIVQTFVLVLMLTALAIAPLFWPVFTGIAIHDLASTGLPSPENCFAIVQATLWISVLVFGVGSSVWLALLGMKRRRLLGLWPYLALLLPYYFLMSVAAWAALCDLVSRPYHWHKTEHGLARSSRRNGRRRGALADRE